MSTLRLAVLILITLGAGLAVRRYAIEPVYIASASMEPTLNKGRHLFLDKFTYRLREPRRQELICFRSPVTGDHDSVKRVIAVHGDTVELKQKKVFLNGEPQYEGYVKYTRAAEALEGDTLGPLAVPEGSFFVLGDNRDNSDDSSSWRDAKTGARLYFIERGQIKGKVRGIY